MANPQPNDINALPSPANSTRVQNKSSIFNGLDKNRVSDVSNITNSRPSTTAAMQRPSTVSTQNRGDLSQSGMSSSPTKRKIRKSQVFGIIESAKEDIVDPIY